MKRVFWIIVGISLPVLAQEVVFEDSFENHDPVIVSTPVTTAAVGSPYGYDVDAEDIDDDVLLYLLAAAPEGMTIDPTSGLIQWTPDTLGVFPVTVDVSDGQGGAAVQAWDLEVLELIDSDGDGLSDDDEALAGTDPDDPDTDDDGVLDGAEVLIHDTDPLDPDSDDDTFPDGSELAVGTDPLDPNSFPIVPPNPQEVAPAPDPSVAGNVRDNLGFLYSGPDPIQTGVDPNTIELKRAALLRGRVFTRLGAPLPGVIVSVVGHPEFGSTLSRADGRFDLVVNGGGPLTVDYQRSGFLPSQRKVDVDWQEYALAPDVALIPLDPVVTPIDLGTPGTMKVARGSVQGDDDGNRQATILFPAGVSAELRMPDDSTTPITGLSVRATEFTVGDRGEMAMPGDLPPTSGYTYAVELSVDEAMAMGATSVDFDQPLPFYVENFLGFPAGTPVPTGYYDRILGAWVPAPDGLVIKIVSESGGIADIDIDGDDVADMGAPLADLGITDAELTQIASLYEPGQSLWRVPVEHFTSWDHNWPIGPPNDAEYPNQGRPYSDTLEDGICEIPGGSFIECQNQVLRERVPVTGTPFTLNHNGSRTPGRSAARHLDIPLTDDSNPASLIRVDLRVAVAGQVHEFSYDAVPELTQALTWDGLDAFGRPLQGTSTANVRIGYVYEGVYRTGGSGSASFGQPGQLPIEVDGNRTRADFILPQEYQATIGAWDARGQGLGAWSLNVHHAYDARNQVLYRGDGTRRSAEHIPAIITNAVGAVDEDGYAEGCGYLDEEEEIPDPGCGDGLPADEAGLDHVQHFEFGPDGSMYIVDNDLNRVRRVRPDGIIENFAGTGESYVSSQDGSLSPNGDGGPALQAKLANPYSIAVDAQGNVYIGEIASQAKRIRMVDTNGIIRTFAGTGDIYPPVGPALEVEVWPLDLETDRDGNLYVTDYCTVFRIDPEGHSSVIAGDPEQCGSFSGDGGPATLAGIGGEGFALGPDGSIYFADSGNYRIRRITKDGIIRTVAGTGVNGFSGDGGPALSAEIGFVFDIDVADNGSIYIADQRNARLRLVDPDGIIRTVAGLGFSFDESGLNGPAPGAWLYPFYLETGPDGDLYAAHPGSRSLIMVIKSPLSGLGAGELVVPAETGEEIYKFDSAGRHLQTVHALTGGVLFEFAYDVEGRLASVTDGDGNVTSVQRDGAGHPTGILGPFGQVTTLAVDANGFLETITNPAGESLQIQSTPDGLITQMTDPRGRISTYGYDALGRLTSQSDNASQSQTLVRSQIDGDFSVARSTGLNRTVNYDVERTAGTSQSNTNTAPDGSQGSTQYQLLTGTTDATSATGMSSTVAERADPRFGMQAPLVKSAQVTAPGGPTLTVASSSVAELSDPDDPLSLVSLSSTATINTRTLASVYTAASKSREITSPEGRITTITTDDLGRVVSRKHADLATITTAFNGSGQLTNLTAGSGPGSRTTSFTYGTDGFREEITNALGQVTSFERDAAGRVTTTVLHDGTEVLTAYNTAGDLVGLTPPGRTEHVFTYDLHGQVTSIVPPAVDGSGPTLLEYNDDRQLSSIARPGGEGVVYSYDNAGRVQTIELIEDGAQGGMYSYTYLPGSRIDSVVGPAAQGVSYVYQGDVVVSETWSGVVEGEISWVYDDGFRLSSENVAGGSTINYGYDDDDLLVAVGEAVISRNALNGLAEGADLGVVQETITRNEFGEVVSITVTANAAAVYVVSYSRDALGRVSQKTETMDGPTDTYDYEYDLNGQLTEVRKNSVIVESYSYDDNGNRLSATIESAVSNGTFDAQDRLVDYGDSAFTYSPSGRLASRTDPGDIVTAYDYDAAGNLLNVTLHDATQVSYGVDGLDRRVQRAVEGTITHRWLYDGLQPLAELDESNTVTSQFVYAGGHVPIYLKRDGTNYRLVTDVVGSIRLVIDSTDGTIVQRLDYDSFGNVTNDTNPGFQPFGFAGGLYDSSTGLVRFGERDYDPVSGRWTAKDPTGFTGMDSNLYRYANNDPVNKVDSSGLDFWDAALGAAYGWYDLSASAFADMLRLNPGFSGAIAIYDTVDAIFDFNEPHIGDLLPPPGDLDDFQAGYLGLTCTVAAASIPLTAGVGAISRGAQAAQTANRLRAAREAAQQARRLGGGQVLSHQSKNAKDLQQIDKINKARQAANQAKGKEALENISSSGWKTGSGGGGPLNGFGGGG